MTYQQLIESTRKLRSKLLEPIGKLLLKLKLTANHLTFLSFILGLTAIYFLFQNHSLFIIFAVLHLTADAFDGILARLTKPTLIGKYFDYFTDRSITFLIFIKLYFFLQDYYVLLILVLFLLSQTIHLLSKFNYPVFFLRSGGLILLALYPLFSHKPFLTFSYLLAGTFCLYSLLLQLKTYLKTRTFLS